MFSLMGAFNASLNVMSSNYTANPFPPPFTRPLEHLTLIVVRLVQATIHTQPQFELNTLSERKYIQR